MHGSKLFQLHLKSHDVGSEGITLCCSLCQALLYKFLQCKEISRNASYVVVVTSVRNITMLMSNSTLFQTGPPDTVLLFSCSGMAQFSCHSATSAFDVMPCDLVASNVLVAAAALHQV